MLCVSTLSQPTLVLLHLNGLICGMLLASMTTILDGPFLTLHLLQQNLHPTAWPRWFYPPQILLLPWNLHLLETGLWHPPLNLCLLQLPTCHSFSRMFKSPMLLSPLTLMHFLMVPMIFYFFKKLMAKSIGVPLISITWTVLKFLVFPFTLNGFVFLCWLMTLKSRYITIGALVHVFMLLWITGCSITPIFSSFLSLISFINLYQDPNRNATNHLCNAVPCFFYCYCHC